MTPLLNKILSWFESLNISDSQMVELGIILFVFLAGYFVSQQIRSSITTSTRHSLEEKSQKYFDVKHTTLIAIAFISINLWVTEFFFGYTHLKVDIIEKANLILLAWVAIRSVTHLCDQSLLSRFVANVLWIVSAVAIGGNLGELSKVLKSYSYTVGKTTLSLHTFLMGIIIFSLLFWVSSLLAALVKKYIKHNRKMNQTQKVLVMKIVRMLLYTLVFIAGFQIVGLDLTTITVFGGAIGFGIGFGLQKVFSNLISGMILLLDKSIKPGDVIAVAGTYGEVTKLDARYVSVVTRDGKKHLIPNENLISERVENWSYSDHEVRLHIPIGVSYGSDLQVVQKLLLEAADEGSDRILKKPAPACLLMGFGDSSVDFELRVWISDPKNGCEKPQSDILLKIWDKFQENDIIIPYPQREVRVISNKKGLFG